MNKLILLFLISLTACSVIQLSDVREQLLAKHNYYRARHGVNSLVRNSELEEIAQTYSDYLTKNNLFTHSDNKYKGNYMGENLYAGTLLSNIGEACTDLWYNEIQYYDFNNPGFGSNTGHFTQVVWKNTQQMGCGMGCKSNYCKITCNYYPAGNYLGQFDTNVFPLSSTEPEQEETVIEETDNEGPVNQDTTTEEVINNNEDTTTTNSESTEEDTELRNFRNSIIHWHNYYRNLHQVDDLVADNELNRIAQEASEYMASIDNFSFTNEKYNGEYIGQNAFYFYASPDGKSIVDLFYNGYTSYDFNSPGYSDEAGGFTQVVWKNSKKIGSGYACTAQNICYGLIVYYPAGNYQGEFEENVFPKVS